MEISGGKECLSGFRHNQAEKNGIRVSGTTMAKIIVFRVSGTTITDKSVCLISDTALTDKNSCRVSDTIMKEENSAVGHKVQP